MAYSTQRAVSDGTMAYLDISIEYMKREDIAVFYNDLPADPSTWAWVGTTEKRIAFTPNVPNGVEVLIKRTTQIDEIINIFALGAKFNNSTMDTNFTQLLYLNQEAVEGAALTDIFNDVDFHGYKIKNLGNAVNDNEAITFGQVKGMSTGAYNAQLAAEAARDKAQQWATQTPAPVESGNYSAKQYALNASASASAAATSETNAAGAASAASSSAASANTSKVAAQAAQAAAESARDDAQAAAAPATELIARVDAVEVVADQADDKADTAISTANAASSAVASKVAQTQYNNYTRYHTKSRLMRGGVGTTTVTLTAERLWLRNAAGDIVSVSKPSTAYVYNSTTAGPAAGGRDQAGNFVSQWTYVYWIYNPTTDTVALTGSATAPSESSSPTLPAGYTYWGFATSARVGVTANNMVNGAVRGDFFQYAINQAVILNGGLGNGVTYTLTNQLVYVPPNAFEWWVSGTLAPVTGPGNVELVECYFSPDGASGTYGYWIFRALFNGSGVTQNIDRGPTRMWQTTSSTPTLLVSMDTGGSCNAQIWVTGYTMPNGAF